MAETPLRPFKGYDDPLDLVDRTEIDYEERLALLQEWQSALAAADAPDEHRDALMGAIQALEAGVAYQGDQSDEVPDGHGYGVQNKS